MTGWADHPDRQLAEQALTVKQLETWKLRVSGYSLSQIGYALQVGIPTIRQRLRAIDHKLDTARKEAA